MIREVFRPLMVNSKLLGSVQHIYIRERVKKTLAYYEICHHTSDIVDTHHLQCSFVSSFIYFALIFHVDSIHFPQWKPQSIVHAH